MVYRYLFQVVVPANGGYWVDTGEHDHTPPQTTNLNQSVNNQYQTTNLNSQSANQYTSSNNHANTQTGNQYPSSNSSSIQYTTGQYPSQFPPPTQDQYNNYQDFEQYSGVNQTNINTQSNTTTTQFNNIYRNLHSRQKSCSESEDLSTTFSDSCRMSDNSLCDSAYQTSNNNNSNSSRQFLSTNNNDNSNSSRQFSSNTSNGGDISNFSRQFSTNSNNDNSNSSRHFPYPSATQNLKIETDETAHIYRRHFMGKVSWNYRPISTMKQPISIMGKVSWNYRPISTGPIL